MAKGTVILRDLRNAALWLCPFSDKPICKFPCRVCKICRLSKGCMSCIEPDRMGKFPCTDYNMP